MDPPGPLVYIIVPFETMMSLCTKWSSWRQLRRGTSWKHTVTARRRTQC